MPHPHLLHNRILLILFSIFHGTKHEGYFFPGRDASPVQGYPTPSIKFAGTHLYTLVEIGTVRVKGPVSEQNPTSPARSNVLIIRPLLSSKTRLGKKV